MTIFLDKLNKNYLHNTSPIKREDDTKMVNCNVTDIKLVVFRRKMKSIMKNRG